MRQPHFLGAASLPSTLQIMKGEGTFIRRKKPLIKGLFSTKLPMIFILYTLLKLTMNLNTSINSLETVHDLR